MTMRCFIFYLHIFLFHFTSFSSSSSSNLLCHPEDSYALLQFKSSFTKYTDDTCEEKLVKTKTWKNGTNCCSWHGVTCDIVSGHVIGLDLGCESFKGKIYPNSTLFRLAHLQSLNLSYNDFSGTHFYSKFGRFQSLTHLDLSSSNFQGEVPPQISHLSKLTSLRLFRNPDLSLKETTLKSFMQNATILKELILDDTDMSLIHPNLLNLIFNQSSSLISLSLRSTRISGTWKKNILCLPSIQQLDMSDNEYLEGQLPDLSCSTSLRMLDLSYCLFKGPIPLYFSNLTFLTSLRLTDNKLNGSIPSSLLTLPHLTFLSLKDNVFISGQIPNVFPQSNRFQELDLSGNKIRGELPTSLSNLQHLINLDLSSNSFSGQIPDVFDRLTKLQELSLFYNRLEGQIPPSLFSLSQLDYLDCSYNKLKGPLPNKITGFQIIGSLALNNNLLSGKIPSWCLSLPSLSMLDLSTNQFTGNISAFSSYSLRFLNLCNNKLQGEIPESIFNLANLTRLCLSSNNLSGVVNFQHFSKLQKLMSLSLSYNSQLSLNFESNVNYNFSILSTLELSSIGLIGFSKLSSGKFPDLTYLALSDNKLGRLPNWLLKIDSLQYLGLSHNLFTSMDQFTRNHWQNLIGLDLSFNLLDDDLSMSICNMSSLELLNLAHNKLSGIIPQCFVNLPFLQVLDLQMNKFYGTIPSNISQGCNLHTFNLNGNLLEGVLPKSLSNCKNMEVLNLGSNKIEDHFPNWIQTMPYLEVLVLRENKLYGPIANINIKHPFPNLIIFDISSNNFCGPLPQAYIQNFDAMKNVIQVGQDSGSQYMKKTELGAVTYYDSVTMTVKGNSIVMVKISLAFANIDLSQNKFEGEIPNFIGELQALKGLNLSHNRLTGPIPQSIGNLSNMESLDLSSNILTGAIPAALTNLNGLEVLNLSYNHLIGEIPQGAQFNTFSNDSYEGNIGLCGFPLSKICGTEQHSPPSPNFWSEEKFGFGWKPVAIGYGCGTAFGIGLGYYVFLIGKPRWLVMIFGGQPKRRMNRRRSRVRRTHGSTMN